VPTYNYKCHTCEGSYERIYPILEKPDHEVCPECKTKMIEVYHAPVITFAGNGFYSTDKKGK
jgi:putative FmdB family regulatory protein